MTFTTLDSILLAVFVFPLIFVQFPTSTISVKEHLYKFDIFYNFQIKFGPAIKRGCWLFCRLNESLIEWIQRLSSHVLSSSAASVEYALYLV